MLKHPLFCSVNNFNMSIIYHNTESELFVEYRFHLPHLTVICHIKNYYSCLLGTGKIIYQLAL